MYPVMLDVRGRRVLVVGAGPVAARKAAGLLEEGAVVVVVAPEVSAEVRALTGPIEIRQRAYRSEDVDGAWLVMTATGDPVVQQQVHDDAVAVRCWVNAADDPDRCAFILPAVHRDGPVTVAVSTSGASPALAQWLRDRLRACIPANVAEVGEMLRARRAEVRAAGGSTEAIDWRPVIDELLGS